MQSLDDESSIDANKELSVYLQKNYLLQGTKDRVRIYIKNSIIPFEK